MMFMVDMRCSSFSSSSACPSISCDRNWEASSSQPAGTESMRSEGETEIKAEGKEGDKKIRKEGKLGKNEGREPEILVKPLK